MPPSGGYLSRRAGAILALEVSRLSRSSDDWRQLLRLCAVADIVVVDEQAIYHPSDPDDKLLLSLKGTMSEAELHKLRSGKASTWRVWVAVDRL